MVTRRARLLGRALLATSVLFAFGAGCADLLNFERLIEEVADGGVISREGLGEAGGNTAPPIEGGLTCTDLGIAAPPTGDAGDAGDTAPPGDIELAVRLLDFGLDPNAELVGFNLDRACSTTSDTSTCKTEINEPTFRKYGADKNSGGLDNAGFALLAYLASLGDSFSPSGIRDRLIDGEFGVVIRIIGWNGLPDDSEVRVEVFPSLGIPTNPDSSTPQPGGKPTFTASDRWLRDNRYQQVLTDNSRIKSASAYVVGNRLVASFPSVTLGISVPDDPKPLDIIVQEAFFTGLLVSSETSWRVDQAILGGRWRTADFLDQVRTIYVKDTPPLERNVLCDPGFATVVYEQVKNEICGGRDIRGASVEDSKGMPCNAFSVGIRVDTYAIDKAGPFVALSSISPERCIAPGSVPKGDDCSR